MNPAMKVKNIKYTNANISFGYAYNWVFARNCLACLSLTPAIAYKASDVDAETNEAKAWYGKFNLDFLVRAGIVYNTGKYYVATSFVGKNYNYHRNNFSVDNGFGTLQIYAGFNFNTRKEYRKRNNTTETRNHQLACLSKESLYICHVLTNKSKKSMKQQRHIQTTRTLLSRFRYWGRKNYAAFASMGREFQIGHLHINVVDVALRKQNAAQTIPYHTFMTPRNQRPSVGGYRHITRPSCLASQHG